MYNTCSTQTYLFLSTPHCETAYSQNYEETHHTIICHEQGSLKPHIPLTKLRKTTQIVVFSLLFLGSIGCSPKFEPQYEKGEKAFAKKDYVETIDAMTMAIPAWKESHGKC